MPNREIQFLDQQYHFLYFILEEEREIRLLFFFFLQFFSQLEIYYSKTWITLRHLNLLHTCSKEQTPFWTSLFVLQTDSQPPWASQCLSAEHREIQCFILHQEIIFFQELLTQAWALLNNPPCFGKQDHRIRTFLNSAMSCNCKPEKVRIPPCCDSSTGSQVSSSKGHCIVLSQKSCVPPKWVQKNFQHLCPHETKGRAAQQETGEGAQQIGSFQTWPGIGACYNTGFQSMYVFLPLALHCKQDSQSSSSLRFSSYPFSLCLGAGKF